MHFVHEIRIQMGLSQRIFASLLDVSQTTLHFVEMGKRSLPPDAWDKCMRLRNNINQATPQVDEVIIGAINVHLKKQMRKLRLEESRLQMVSDKLTCQLRDMKQAYRKRKNAVRVLSREIKLRSATRSVYDMRKYLTSAMDPFLKSLPQSCQIMELHLQIAKQSLTLLRQRIAEIERNFTY